MFILYFPKALLNITLEKIQEITAQLKLQKT